MENYNTFSAQGRAHTTACRQDHYCKSRFNRDDRPVLRVATRLYASLRVRSSGVNDYDVHATQSVALVCDSVCRHGRTRRLQSLLAVALICDRKRFAKAATRNTLEFLNAEKKFQYAHAKRRVAEDARSVDMQITRRSRD